MGLYRILSCTYRILTYRSGSTAFPFTMAILSSVFESLLPKLLAILQVTQRPEGTSNVRNKQDLLQAVSHARIATLLPNELRTHSYTDSSVQRSPQSRALPRECASRRRTAYRGSRR